MNLTIPYQAFEVNNIHLTPFQIDRYGKTIARLAYKDNSIDFQDVSLLTPPMKVIDYHPETSRLRLDISEHPQFMTKMATFHDYLVSTFFVHQQSFLNVQGRSYEAIRHLFYFLLDGSVLSVFINPSSAVKMQTQETKYVSDLKPGNIIRCLLRLQGVSQMVHHHSFTSVYGQSDIRLRLHHSVPSIWFLEDKSEDEVCLIRPFYRMALTSLNSTDSFSLNPHSPPFVPGGAK